MDAADRAREEMRRPSVARSGEPELPCGLAGAAHGSGSAAAAAGPSWLRTSTVWKLRACSSSASTAAAAAASSVGRASEITRVKKSAAELLAGANRPQFTCESNARFSRVVDAPSKFQGQPSKDYDIGKRHYRKPDALAERPCLARIGVYQRPSHFSTTPYTSASKQNTEQNCQPSILS